MFGPEPENGLEESTSSAGWVEPDPEDYREKVSDQDRAEEVIGKTGLDCFIDFKMSDKTATVKITKKELRRMLDIYDIGSDFYLQWYSHTNEVTVYSLS